MTARPAFAERALFRAVRALRSVHAAWVWRLLYRCLSSRLAVRLGASLIRRGGDDDAVRRAADAAHGLVTWSGWPHQSPGWVNLDTSRYLTRVERRALGAPARTRPTPRARRTPFRLGCIGPFSGLVTFSREHFVHDVDDLEIVVFDLPYAGALAPYLDGVVTEYRPFPDPSADDVARAVDAAGLDLVLLVVRGREGLELADLIETPIAYVCTGSDLLHHPAIAFHVYVQPQADYFDRDGVLFCGTAAAPFGPEPIASGFFAYDARGLDGKPVTPWGEREHRVFFHGGLYKAASTPFLDQIFALLREDDALEFVLMGRDNGSALATIEDGARAAGVAARVHYDGDFGTVRSLRGAVEDAGWSRVVDHLASARLAPNPWPMGGGGARVEAYLSGVPTAHLAVRFDRAAWGRAQHSIVELPDLLVPEASATTPGGYRELCRRLLVDETFAASVVDAQLEVASRVCDGSTYWRQILDMDAAWRSHRLPGGRAEARG
jgi:hypothetical protein